MPGPWRKNDSGYTMLRPEGGYLRVCSKHFGRSIKVWEYSVVDAKGRVEDHGLASKMFTARTLAERRAGLET